MNQKITETKFYKMVMEELSRILVKEYELTNNDFHIIRLESPSSPGLPDFNVCIKHHQFSSGLEFWIECKVYPGVLGSYQIAWKKKRELAGGKVFCVTYIDKDKIKLSESDFTADLNQILKIVLRRVGI